MLKPIRISSTTFKLMQKTKEKLESRGVLADYSEVVRIVARKKPRISKINSRRLERIIFIDESAYNILRELKLKYKTKYDNIIYSMAKYFLEEDNDE